MGTLWTTKPIERSIQSAQGPPDFHTLLADTDKSEVRREPCGQPNRLNGPFNRPGGPLFLTLPVATDNFDRREFAEALRQPGVVRGPQGHPILAVAALGGRGGVAALVGVEPGDAGQPVPPA
jgi:hypothetical protein